MPRNGKLRAQFAAFHRGRPIAPYDRPTSRIAKTYCILFTPRSGSTWLTRRIARLDLLSCPEEFFIADEFANTLKFNPGRDLYEVFDLVAAKNGTCDGIFGFEISYFDLEEFEREARLLDVMAGEPHFFCLTRRNFVAQAISLYTAVESQVFHVYGDQPVQRGEVPYSDDRILYWTCHILQQEFGIARWLDANRIKPIFLKYEELLEDIDGAIARIADDLGVDLRRASARATPQTEKITAGLAAEFEREFRSRHWEFCRHWEAARGTAPCPYSPALLPAAE